MVENIRDVTVRVGIKQVGDLTTGGARPNVDPIVSAHKKVAASQADLTAKANDYGIKAGASFAQAGEGVLQLTKAMVLLTGANDKTTAQWIKQLAIMEGVIAGFRGTVNVIKNTAEAYRHLQAAATAAAVAQAAGTAGALTKGGLAAAAVSPPALAAAAVAFTPHILMLKEANDLRRRAAELDERGTRAIERQRERKEEQLRVSRAQVAAEERLLTQLEAQKTVVDRLVDSERSRIRGQIGAAASAREQFINLSPADQARTAAINRTDPGQLNDDALRQRNDPAAMAEKERRTRARGFGRDIDIAGQLAGQTKAARQGSEAGLDAIAAAMTAMTAVGGIQEQLRVALERQRKAVETATVKQDAIVASLDRLSRALEGHGRPAETAGPAQRGGMGPFPGGTLPSRVASGIVGAISDFIGNTR